MGKSKSKSVKGKPAPDKQISPAVNWPANSVEMVPIADLVPYARNARTHSESQIAQIRASMREFGWTIPVLRDENDGIIAGHGRILAAKAEGITHAPCMMARGWSDAKKRAYIIADNKLALNAGWDEEMLAAELQQLMDDDFDMALTGFGEDELAELFAETNDGLTDPDATPEAPANPASIEGDVWILGRHRIICGDSTKAEVVEKVLAGVKPHLMVTDPPYGVSYDPNWRNEQIKGSATKRTGKVLNDERADWREAWALFPGDVAYVWHGMKTSRDVWESLESSGFLIRAEIVWAKPRLIISRGDYHAQHESAWYAVRKGKVGHWSGDRKQTTLWNIDPVGQDSETVHSTQKPVECMRRPIENNSSAGQAIYEPFSGSGTSIIACEQTGRACHAVELNPAYVDVAVIRWQEFTGQTATLEGDGRSFEEVQKARAKGARSKAPKGAKRRNEKVEQEAA